MQTPAPSPLLVLASVCMLATALPAQTWVRMTDAPGPWLAATYDAGRARVVALVGSATWEWDGARWTERTPAVGPPAGAFGQVMTHDAARAVVLLYWSGETWAWDGVTWRQHSPATSPPDAAGAIAFDAARGRAVLIAASGTWEWDGSGWSLQGTAPFSGADASRGRVAVTDTYAGEHWEWSGSAWAVVARSAPFWRYDSDGVRRGPPAARAVRRRAAGSAS